MDFNNLSPLPEEKKRLRHNYNTVGITLIALFVLIDAVCMTLYSVFCQEIQYSPDGYPVYGAKEMLIAGWTPALLAIAVFIGYCLCTRYNPRELFSTDNPGEAHIGKYVLMVLGAQQVSMICTIILSNIFYYNGLEVTGLNYEISHDPATYAIDIFASVILAPIGEELIFRGVVLRCCAKVSQKFAIFFSAFIFGIMHGNPYQFVLGFLIGIPMAIITIRTGSIIPSIICHMANNIVACIPTVISYFDEPLSEAVSLAMIPVFLIIGIWAFVSEISSGRMRLPAYTDHHKKRTLPLIYTSWSMIVITIFYVYDLITSVGPIEEVPEMIEQSARLFIL